ncbi:inclusion membrane protein IncB [Chlamydia vaughanii]|uniref:inclusion membrane protein IncB n=1 Tax=Chlamydia vaughanii TaxID=3112552 RepID=UPI0032B0F4B3
MSVHHSNHTLPGTQDPQEALDAVLLRFNRRINETDRKLEELEERLSATLRSTAASAELATVSANTVAADLIDLQDEVTRLKSSMGAMTDVMLQTAGTQPKPSPSTQSGVSYMFGRTPPSTCSKVTAMALTILALLSIIVLIICVVAACGGFPLLLSALNMCTVGACISLPIMACGAVAVLVLASLSIGPLLQGDPALFKVKHSQIES